MNPACDTGHHDLRMLTGNDRMECHRGCGLTLLVTSSGLYDITGLTFKVSDTPRSGPEGISGHPGTPGPPNNKEIA